MTFAEVSVGVGNYFDYGDVKEHVSPFALYLISINPTIILGVEKDDKQIPSTQQGKEPFISSTFLDDLIMIRINPPYKAGAKVIWFAPSMDNKLHQIDLAAGTANFAINKREQITITVEGSELKTMRKNQ
jgi:hypothetical protein